MSNEESRRSVGGAGTGETGRLSSYNLVLGVDLDGVVAKFHEGLINFIYEETGCHLPPPTDWDLTKDWDMTQEELREWFSRATKAGLYRNLDVVDGAPEMLWKLQDAGVHIRIITHRLYMKAHHDIIVSDTAKWLQKVNIPYWDLCMIGEKFDVGADVYIDDGPHVIESLRRAGKQVIVFDRAYNRHLGGPRVRSWDEVGRFFTNVYGIDLESARDEHPVWPVHS